MCGDSPYIETIHRHLSTDEPEHEAEDIKSQKADNEREYCFHIMCRFCYLIRTPPPLKAEYRRDKVNNYPYTTSPNSAHWRRTSAVSASSFSVKKSAKCLGNFFAITVSPRFNLGRVSV